ncbi:family 16 glycosylhydrolase [Vreelandella sp. H-I2]
MNPVRPYLAVLRWAFRLGHGLRRVLPMQTSVAFGTPQSPRARTIEKIYVINLDRESGRWARVKQELGRIRDRLGDDLLSLTERHAAVDARCFLQDPSKDSEVDPYYTLADQLFVEPQPLTLPTSYELDAPIRMSRAEVAVAKSHIEVWKRVAQGPQEYVLILEDDVWFHPGFARHLDQAWKNFKADDQQSSFDVLYVSYMEVKHGAPKSLVSNHVFRPVRGLWFLSGYILSKKGAEKLLSMLPCRGPVDLWINHQFRALEVYATKRSIILQRTDTTSTNSYSILPALSTIGAINSEEAALFNTRPTQFPVFTFGPANSGQSSIGMALLMLGYRCCSDLKDLPIEELKRLREGNVDRVFNAYVNIGCIESMIGDLRHSYPQAKFIVTTDAAGQTACGVLADLEGADVVVLDCDDVGAWRTLCEHLRCAPPLCSFPKLDDLGQRHIGETPSQPALTQKSAIAERDRSPWVVESSHRAWSGIRVIPQSLVREDDWVDAYDTSGRLDSRRWTARSDTFTGNLALFRPQNIEFDEDEGATIHVRREEMGARQYSAGALTSHTSYLFGRFESTFQASSVPGIVTGFFLHRNSPHQEIDIEIAGNLPNRLLVNVFYNPGDEGAQFDYGYRGAPSYIELGFDASKGMHRYAIEWTPWEIRWFVDDLLIHRRVLWDPTPIPHLPMKLHFNTWPTRSAQLAGRLNARRLPTVANVQSIRALAHRASVHEPKARVLHNLVGTVIKGVQDEDTLLQPGP